jgi:phosphoribosylformimino-5-aminoimidazole carboxamide ribotide isomerase
MQVIPAIDLRAGRVVRLRQGDFANQQAYGDDSLEVARRWVAQGAERLHLVDLDGASAGQPAQLAWLGPILSGAGVPCQVGGGLRELEAARLTLAAGADRVILGTALLGGADVARPFIRALGASAVIAAIDVRDGLAVGQAWRPGGPTVPYESALEGLWAGGVRRFAITAIDRDGMLDGPDLALLADARRRLPEARILAAGGVASLGDLAALASLGLEGAILGRALYEGRFSLPDAARAAG